MFIPDKYRSVKWQKGGAPTRYSTASALLTRYAAT